jgi:hypothetical protein
MARLPFPYFSVGSCSGRYLELIIKFQVCYPLRTNPVGNQPTAHPVADLALKIPRIPKIRELSP